MEGWVPVHWCYTGSTCNTATQQAPRNPYLPECTLPKESCINCELVINLKTILLQLLAQCTIILINFSSFIALINIHLIASHTLFIAWSIEITVDVAFVSQHQLVNQRYQLLYNVYRILCFALHQHRHAVKWWELGRERTIKPKKCLSQLRYISLTHPAVQTPVFYSTLGISILNHSNANLLLYFL